VKTVSLSPGVCQQLQALGDKDTVFTLQGHNVGDGTQTDHVRIIPENFLLVTAEGSGQLEGHTYTGKILVGIAAVGPVGIHHRNGMGKDLFALVVVGNHQIHT
jgi:hypothetical protein